MMLNKKNSIEAGEAELEQVLQNFRESVHGWSEAEFARPRQLAAARVHRTWKLAAGWALGCVLAVGGLSAGVYEHVSQQTAKSNAAQPGHTQQAEKVAPSIAPVAIAHDIAARVEQATKVDASEPDVNLLAAVDSDVSRQVPSAMEPLAQLMESNSIQ